MKLADILKHEPPFADLRRKLREAIEAGKIHETDPAVTAVAKVLDSLDLTVFAMTMEEFGGGTIVEDRNVHTLLWHLELLDQHYEIAHKITVEKHTDNSRTRD
jgi:hypothetical protein